MSHIDHYTTAAFISAGMHRDIKLLEKARNAVDTGCIELVSTAMRYTDYINDLSVIGAALSGGVPGVFDYEVSEEFGGWYVHMVYSYKALPTVIQCTNYLISKVHTFFTKDAEQGSIIAGANGLEAALANVYTPIQPEL